MSTRRMEQRDVRREVPKPGLEERRTLFWGVGVDNNSFRKDVYDPCSRARSVVEGSKLFVDIVSHQASPRVVVR